MQNFLTSTFIEEKLPQEHFWYWSKGAAVFSKICDLHRPPVLPLCCCAEEEPVLLQSLSFHTCAFSSRRGLPSIDQVMTGEGVPTMLHVSCTVWFRITSIVRNGESRIWGATEKLHIHGTSPRTVGITLMLYHWRWCRKRLGLPQLHFWRCRCIVRCPTDQHPSDKVCRDVSKSGIFYLILDTKEECSSLQNFYLNFVRSRHWEVVFLPGEFHIWILNLKCIFIE